MKKLFTLFAAAMLFTSANAASTYQIVGGFNSWDLKTAVDLAAQGDGTFVGTVEELTSGFKIVGDRDWHPQYGMLSADDELKVGTPLTLGVAETEATPDFANIELEDGVISISNAVVTFNPTAKTLLINGQVKRGYVDLYISGSFCAWAEPGSKAEYHMDREEDLYYITVNFVDAGTFKLFGAGWAPEFGFASQDDAIAITEDNPTVVIKRGGGVDIPCEITGECVVEFNYSTSELTVTKLGDLDPNDIDLYVSGSFCGWATPGGENGSVKMDKNGAVYTCDVELEGIGELKIYGEGWAPQFGYIMPAEGEEAPAFVTLVSPETKVTLYRGQEGNVPYDCNGLAHLSFNIETGELIFTSDADGIDNVTVSNNVPVAYYNLQGIRVANPQAGCLYIAVKGGEVSKVVR